MIKIQCGCGKSFNIPEKYRGKQGRCPQCGTIIVVPKEDEEIPLFDAVVEPVKQSYSAQDLFERVIDTVVGISDDGRLYGSGVIVDDKGGIVTNRHVVGVASKVKVRLNSGEEYIGELLASYKDTDLAFISIPYKTESFVPLSGQANLKIGQTLYAIGHPMGLQNTITRGIVSALNREIDGLNYIQTDASINPGNSGGPLFNEQAELVGINTMILHASQGLGFAIPSETAFERYVHIQQNIITNYKFEYCGICGKNSGNRRFCEHCGVELDSRQPLTPMNPRFQPQMQPVSFLLTECTVCKSGVYPDDKYCSFCGTTVAN
jgi:S1-C subfamily serine protease